MLNNIFSGWRRGLVLFATFLFLIAVGFNSTGCKKKNNLMGADSLDPNELLLSGGVDTFSLTTYTVEDDNVRTQSARYCLLGIANDPEFGITDVGFYTQARLSGLSPNFGDPSQITIDSFVLAMEYVGGYGAVGTQTFEVFEVDERMYADSNYTANQDLAIKTENWVQGSGSLMVMPTGGTIVGNDTLRTQLRIPLNPAKAMQLIQDAVNQPGDFASNSAFTSNYLKGLYVKTNGTAPAENKGMIAYFDLTTNNSKLSIYYKENGAVMPKYDLVFNTETVDYNRFKIDNTGKRITTVIADSTLGNEEFYVQSGKYRAKIDLPSVKNLPDNIVIHKAQLFLPAQYLPGSVFKLPVEIALIHPNVSQLYQATYNSTLKGYVFDIREIVQSLKLGLINTSTLTISTSSFVASAERVVFNGQLTDNKVKPRLIISYTEF